MWNKVVGVALAAALVGVVAVSNGCSSSSGGAGGGGDASSDTGVVVKKDSGGSSSGSDGSGGDDGGEAGVAFDGTSGKTCASDADCDGGAGINKCSIDYDGQFAVTGLKVSLWPSPICIVPPTAPNCDPCGLSAGGTCAGGQIWGCDSDPTTLDPTTSPGLCLPNDPTAPAANQGVCIPRCQLPLDGSKATGVTAPNTCVSYTWLEETTGTIIGLGFVQGSCQADADCKGLGTGWVCQVDIGFCTQATAQKARTKTIGEACTSGSAATTDSSTGACNCISSGTATNMGTTSATIYAGFCSSSCVVGGTACPNGYVCDAFYPSGPLVFGDASAPALTMQNTGVVGTCIQPCTNPDAGTTADGGAQCPPTTSCLSETLEGPDCLP